MTLPLLAEQDTAGGDRDEEEREDRPRYLGISKYPTGSWISLEA
jgi:hypothetical protein